MEDREQQGTVDERELWRMAGQRVKAETIIALERSQRFLWIGAALLIALGVILFFAIPVPKPDVALLAMAENGVAAYAGDRIFIIENCKVTSSFEASEGANSLAFDGTQAALAFLRKNEVEIYRADGAKNAPMSAKKPYLASFIGDKLTVLTSESIEDEGGGKIPAPDFKIPVALLEGPTLVDLDAVWVDGKNVGQKRLDQPKPPKAASFFEGKLRAVYDDMWFEYAKDWSSLKVNKLPKWAVLNKASIVALFGDTLACSNGQTVVLGRLSEEKELCKISVWERQ